MSKLIIEKRTYNEKAKEHSHEHGQLIIPLQGTLSIETSEKRLSIDEQRIFMLPPDCSHLYKSDCTNSFLVMDIPSYLLNNNDLKMMDGGNLINLDNRWRAIRSLLLEETRIPYEGNKLNSLFQYMYQLIKEEKNFKSVQYIHEHYDTDIDVKTLAAIEHYTPDYYPEWFKRQMGVTPKEYLQKIRLNRAKELLRDSDYSVLQIAQMVGYKHQGSLTRLFKDSFGTTPITYRNSV